MTVTQIITAPVFSNGQPLKCNGLKQLSALHINKFGLGTAIKIEKKIHAVITILDKQVLTCRV
jgi:hypothetical protein